MSYNFPYDPTNGNPLSEQAIFLGVASANAGTPVLMVSTVNAGGTVSLNGDASNNRVSAFSQDAGLLRVSALGVTVTTSPLSADSSRVSAVQGDANILHTSAVQGDAGLFHTSAFVDSGSISAKNQDANFMHVSGFSPDAGLFRVSGIGTFTTTGLSANQQISAVLLAGTANVGFVSAMQTDAASLNVSGKSLDAGLFHVSAFVDSGSISARSGDANQVHVSAVQGDAGLFHVSAFVDSGSVSARSGDANQVHVSAAQGDAGLLHVSGFTSTASNFPVSATQGDASLLRVSAFESVVTTNTGGASYYWTSSGAGGQVSTVKSAAGRLYGYHIGNPAGVDQYLQIFNTSGGAQAGTDAPTLTLYVPTLGGAVMSLGAGIGFSAGIQIVGTSTVNGNSMGASAMRINLFYA